MNILYTSFISCLSCRDVSQEDQQETTTVYILYTQDENTAVQNQTISSSSLLEAAFSDSVTTAQSPAVGGSSLACAQTIGLPQGEHLVMTRPSALPPGGTHGASTISLIRGQPRVAAPKSLLRPPSMQQKMLGGRAIQSPVMQRGIVANIAQQHNITTPRSQFVMQSVLAAKTPPQAVRPINNNKMVTVGGVMSQVAHTAVRSPCQMAPLQQQLQSLRQVSPGGAMTFIRTSNGQMVQVQTSSLTGQRLAEVNAASPNMAPRIPAKPQRFVAQAQTPRPAVCAVTPPRAGIVTPSVAPPAQCRTVVSSAVTAPVSASSPGGQMTISTDASNASLVVGQEYALQYPNGRTLKVIWDGKFFKWTGGEWSVRLFVPE